MALLLRHRLLLPPLLLLAILVAASHGAPSSGGDSYDTSMCVRQPYNCGNVNISYPFYSKMETLLGNDSSYCGYPGMEIQCEEGRAFLELDSGKYTVSRIDYEPPGVWLADPDVLNEGSCPRANHNVTLRNGSWLDYPNDTVDYLVFFINCNFLNVTDIARPPSNTDSTCKFDDEPAYGMSFVFRKEDVPHQDTNWWQVCGKVIEVPVLKSGLPTDPQNDPRWRNGGYGSSLREGFQLAWHQEHKAPSCDQCERSKGQCGYNKTGGYVACLCSGGRVGAPNCTTANSSGSKKTPLKVIAGASAAAAGLAVLGAGAFLFIMRKRRKNNVINSSSKLLKYSGSGGTPRSRVGDMESGSIDDPATHLFTYEELEEATNSFDENRELGDGGFGTVYKGYLKDGRVVAVKRLYNSYRRLEQFHNEAAILSGLRHPNLVMFYGCTSSQSRELLLVYEFVANGTVADHLHGPRAPERALSWPLRLNVAIESAAALAYLHAIEPPVVHRDVKTTNILLDADFHVKVADFGLSRLFPLDVTHVSTAPQGTPGYVDPEYHQCYQLTDKSDVYSFGVVLVELISSKPAVDITRHRNEINLAGMAISKIQKCQLEQLVDLDLGYESDPATKKMMTMVAELAFRCLQQNGEMRPPMKEVLEVLRSIQGECPMEKDGDKHKDGPFSPTTVHAPWDSRATTPNTSRD
ncbi:LEAF RUST 10 DISEASE-RESISTANCEUS RECEPTOR-LIKE PROTEIN KINASE-like 1.2 isoform X5 [Setaria viridis]|uniref:LEAF RUST 10 DISEASE-RESISTANCEUS RECEPTOR-LIKE PROTEIN KINASE-like 1.2 isoform X5 n=1 Tax=Setaria viridis TaxID=4556 RepID=UPI001493ABCB|nr:LEAF RUST 10 DISEASE-RESISTANCE LOCUS RECEPTOR-LIKE PROTEIN KINASE-like 1.2 isoform X5 [Setaria viridis]